MEKKKQIKNPIAYVLNVITTCHYNPSFSPSEMEDMEVTASLRVKNDNARAVTPHPCDVVWRCTSNIVSHGLNRASRDFRHARLSAGSGSKNRPDPEPASYLRA